MIARMFGRAIKGIFMDLLHLVTTLLKPMDISGRPPKFLALYGSLRRLSYSRSAVDASVNDTQSIVCASSIG